MSLLIAVRSKSPCEMGAEPYCAGRSRCAPVAGCKGMVKVALRGPEQAVTGVPPQPLPAPHSVRHALYMYEVEMSGGDQTADDGEREMHV
jgi:hypothetical protein